MERLHPLLRPPAQLVEVPVLDRVGGAGLGAGRLQPVLQPVVAERTLMRPAVGRAERRHAEGAGGQAVAAAVADVLLDVDRVELGADDRAGRAGLQAAGVDAVLADVAEHQPVALEGLQARRPPAGAVAQPLDEGDVAPGGRAQVDGVVVAEASPPEVVRRQLVPLLAGDLAGLAADAQRRVGQEADRAGPRAGPVLSPEC